MSSQPDSEDVLAADIEYTDACDVLIRGEDDRTLDNLDFNRIYLQTHAGSCLQNVLQELMQSQEIDVIQKADLEREFNRIYHEAYGQCQSQLHMSVHAKLAEYSSVDSGSVFELQVRFYVQPMHTFKLGLCHQWPIVLV